MFLRDHCFVNVLILSCLCSLRFGTHPFYSLNPYVYLYYLWSISIVEDRRFAEKCSLRLWWSKPNKIAFFFFFGRILVSNIMVYHKKASDYTTFTLMTRWSFKYFNFWTLPFLKFLWRKVYKRKFHGVWNKKWATFYCNLRIGRISSNLREGKISK